MNHLKTYKLFESLDLEEWSDIKDTINVIEDDLDFEFIRLKLEGEIVSFIFKSNSISEDVESVYKWFIERILNIGQFIYRNNNNEIKAIIKIKSDYRVSADKFPRRYSEIRSLTDITIYRTGYNDYEYHFNFNAYFFSIIEWVIRNPQDKDLLRRMNTDVAIKNLFQYYCRYTTTPIDFSILSVFSDVKDKLIDPVDKYSIKLPHNLSDNFIIDITPVFLEKVFNYSGLIFRLKVSKYYEKRITDKDRIMGFSVAEDTDNRLKKLGLKMTWKDIFIIE